MIACWMVRNRNSSCSLCIISQTSGSNKTEVENCCDPDLDFEMLCVFLLHAFYASCQFNVTKQPPDRQQWSALWAGCTTLCEWEGKKEVGWGKPVKPERKQRMWLGEQTAASRELALCLALFYGFLPTRPHRSPHLRRWKNTNSFSLHARHKQTKTLGSYWRGPWTIWPVTRGQSFPT